MNSSSFDGPGQPPARNRILDRICRIPEEQMHASVRLDAITNRPVAAVLRLPVFDNRSTVVEQAAKVEKRIVAGPAGQDFKSLPTIVIGRCRFPYFDGHCLEAALLIGQDENIGIAFLGGLVLNRHSPSTDQTGVDRRAARNTDRIYRFNGRASRKKRQDRDEAESAKKREHRILSRIREVSRIRLANQSFTNCQFQPLNPPILRRRNPADLRVVSARWLPARGCWSSDPAEESTGPRSAWSQ